MTVALPPTISKALRHLPAPAPFVAVPLGVATVVLIHNPRALIPRHPYWPWLMLLFATALYGLVLQLDLADDLDDFDEGELRAMRWKAAGLAYAVGIIASVTFVASEWLIDRLEAAGF